MNGVIQYLNTDLDLISPEDPTPLVGALESSGLLRALYAPSGADGLWYVTFESEETWEPPREPQINIAAMLTAIEALSGPMRSAWDRCTKREFNLGFDFDCGAGPRSLHHGLPPDLLVRIAAAGASLQITVYRATEAESADGAVTPE